MKKKLLISILMWMLCFGIYAQTTADWYVDINAASGGDGSSWATAYSDLQTAITNGADGDVIFVKKGEYLLTASITSLKEGMAIYGSFSGTETTLVERDLSNFSNNANDATILKSNGSQRVISIDYPTNPTSQNTLNGLVITGGGNADKGGGIYINNASPILRNLIITGNTANEDGYGLGGGIYIANFSPVLTNVVLSGNYATNGGGIHLNNATPILTNVTISGNNANSGGGISLVNNSHAQFNNTIIFSNTANVSSNITVDNSNPVVEYSIVEGFNLGGTMLDGEAYTAADLFADPDNGDYTLKNTSPLINAGSNALYTNAGGNLASDVDAAGNLRLYNGTPDTDVIDLGAYELQRDLIAPISPDANNILYVNKSVSGGNESGNSWENAIPELADAMVRANAYYDNAWETTPLQIFVAKGTYKPLYSPEDGANFGTDQGRDNSFSMIKNVQLYGGFAGTETALLERDLSVLANKTTLSGDIGIENDASDNIYNVLVSAGDLGTASLDGFSITGGNANAYSDLYVNGKQIFKCSGAGVYNSVSSPNYKHVILHNNICTESGGGMFSYMSSPKLQLVIMKNNQAKDGGGMTNQESSSPTLLNVSIESNQASEKGSGMYNVDLSGPTLTNVSIVGNEATVSSEEVPSCVSENSGITLNNSIIWDEISGDYTAQNSLIKGKGDTENGNIDATGLVETDIFNDPANGDFSLKYTSVALNAGSNTLYTDAGGNLTNDLDLAGNLRLNNDLSGTATIDIGAYEFYKTDQVITFEALDKVTFGDANFTLAATTDSDLGISYTSSNTAVATVADNEVTIVGTGTTTITASQAGNDNYNAAASVTQELTVKKANQVITFETLDNVTFGDANFTLAATTNSDLGVSFTSSNTAVATVTDNEVTIVGAGTTTITASQTGNDNYNAATAVTQELVVEKANQVITFELPDNVNFGDANFTLAASSNSGLAITYTSSNTEVATISGNEVSVSGVGITTITASQAGNDNYNAATPVEQTLEVGGITASKKGERVSIDLYPNPTSNVLHINYAKSINTIQLFDAQGKAIETITIKNEEAKIEMMNYPVGLYFIQIDGLSEMYRFIKK
ncbi:hypothetical protein C9994_11925 [Marivirga lumbricoides]|uniref:Secretion system C-terminal sorting domain-containing protein n=1 Tax=Marivirga lumbricoides TaxID=1046115 RepID=A0A2T4DLF2_9BACT|nr:hypothetical protein C9994_11925 [Marivirga lumbricoides]